MDSRHRVSLPRNLVIVITMLATAANAFAETTAPLSGPRSGTARVLRVAADPNNLPFSNERREGFENRIADLLARELGATVEYTWRAQRRGFFRETIKNGLCDLSMGAPAVFERALSTRPYYSSVYVFVWRKGSEFAVKSLDDPILTRARIGVQIIGDDGTNPPPAHALARRGIVNNVVGYTVYGDYKQPSPPARIIDAVAHGDVDVALVWGPVAGYFARKQSVPLELAPVTPILDPPGLPMAYSISMGVRKDNQALRRELDAAMERLRPEVDHILHEYGVPLIRESEVPKLPEPNG